MDKPISKIVVVGGGTAGWLTAGIIAAEHSSPDNHIQVTLVESSDIKPIGVGEGTWPSMRNTLQKIGVSETDFVKCCNASFKQSSKFCQWVNGEANDVYYHPFSKPQGYPKVNIPAAWQRAKQSQSQSVESFSSAFCFQDALCDLDLAPKAIATPEFQTVANYGYHLDAGKFSEFLKQHCCKYLQVNHIFADVTSVENDESGYIKELNTRQETVISGDLFIDCSGFSSILLGQHYQVPFVSRNHQLFADTALAAQVKYPNPEWKIASNTISTAQDAGWIWDIGLHERKGVGYVYSSAHTSTESAEETLMNYLSASVGSEQAKNATLRTIPIKSGHYEKFWVKNCVGVSLAAGFVEPLEASAMVMVELAASYIAEHLPANRSTMEIIAKRYNDQFEKRWESILNFLKLHYYLSRRTESFWIDNRDKRSVPASLLELLDLWRNQYPGDADFNTDTELFPAPSYFYVLYGMGFETNSTGLNPRKSWNLEQFSQCLDANHKAIQKVRQHMPTNNELIRKIKEFGFSKI